MTSGSPSEPDQPAAEPVPDSSGGIVIHGVGEIGGVLDPDSRGDNALYDDEILEPAGLRRRTARRRWPLILAVGCLVLCCLCCILPLCLLPIAGASIAALVSNSEVAVSGGQTLDVAAEGLSLVVDNPLGDVTVEPGAAETVDVRYTKHAYSWSRSSAEQGLAAIQVVIAQPEYDSVRIDVRNSDGPFAFANSVDLTVRVPESLALTITTNGGTIAVRGVRAQALAITTTTGAATFEGALGGDPQSRYTLRTTTGALQVSLPADSALLLDAETRVGSVAVSGFDSEGTYEQGTSGVGDAWRGEIGAGDGERPTLLLRSDTGSITVRGR